MHGRTRTYLAAGAALAALSVIALILLLVQLASPHPAVLVAFGFSAVGVAALAAAAVLIATRDYRAQANRRATRIANLEKRVERANEAAAAAAERGALDVIDARVRELEAGEQPNAELTQASELVDSIVAVARRQGIPLTDVLTLQQAAGQVRVAAVQGRALEAIQYLRAFPEVVRELNLTQARTLLKSLRRLGYLGQTIPLIQEIAIRFNRAEDAKAAALYESELALYRGEVILDVDFPPLEGDPKGDVVLHLVGKALPETQSGYTLRTHYTVEAQRRLGIEPVVVAQAGASERPHAHTETYTHEGIRYYLLGGPQRGSVPWDAWLADNVAALGEVVRAVRPSVLHVHSDFMNAMIALPVGRAYGIPVVNETRGFWEESWLSRTATAEGWTDLDALEERFGMPDMYSLRVEREAAARSESAAVVTLARVMRDHIATVGGRLGLPVPETSIAPNAVEAADFPVSLPDPTLKEELGIEPTDIVVGYISSIVEYEGIDTLLRAMFELELALNAARQLAAPANDDAAVGDLTVDRLADDPGSESTVHDAPAVDGEMHAAAPEQTAVALDESDVEPHDPLTALRASLAASSAAFGRRAEPDAQTHQTDVDVLDEAALVEGPVETLIARLRLVHADLDDDALHTHAVALIAAVEPIRDTPVRLIIVGDGAELGHLRALAAELGIEGVLFTGRVPHERVLDYYALIDLFVVPRKPVAVTELVTPLKPFEALSTGRPCVFSDVGALAEIAQDSGAAELFRAGDHHDLAMTVAALLAHPERLAEMSRDGAEWVRNERTWDLNAITYLEVYRSLGLELEVPAAAAEFMRLREDGIGARTIIQRLASGPAPSPTGWFQLETKSYTAEQIMTDGWRIAKHPAIRFTPELDWEAAGEVNRSWGFHLHAWEFIDPVLKAYEETGDERLLRWMLDVATHWWAAVVDSPVDETMAWYDMALSLRMPRLARLIIAVAKSSFQEETTRLLRPALAHMQHSMRDEAFNIRNNHGFFAAAGSLDFARWLAPLPGSDALRELGAERLRQMLTRQFAADGGHLEHSPDYHRMLLGSFEQAVREELIEDDETRQRIHLAARVLGWMVQPNGRLVQFGDSPDYDVESNVLESTDDRTRFIVTDGREGDPEQDELLVLPDAGYAFVRSPQPAAPGERMQSSYLALQAGFHSRAHKHADDLTFTWFDRGHEILVDAGRFGYVDLLPADSPDRRRGFYYSAPERQYVESTMAHNTVEVNGTDLERRKREPYGSALTECFQDEGRFVLSGQVQHDGHRHARVLTLTPHQSLEVLDTIEPTGEAVDAVSWFNMSGDVELSVVDEALLAVFPDGLRLTIRGDGDLVAPSRGQESPLRGWRSLVDRELVPTWNFGFRAHAASETMLRTAFIFEDDPES